MGGIGGKGRGEGGVAAAAAAAVKEEAVKNVALPCHMGRHTFEGHGGGIGQHLLFVCQMLLLQLMRSSWGLLLIFFKSFPSSQLIAGRPQKHIYLFDTDLPWATFCVRHRHSLFHTVHESICYIILNIEFTTLTDN